MPEASDPPTDTPAQKINSAPAANVTNAIDVIDASLAALTSNRKIQEKLLRLNIYTEMDLVLHLPLRYEDETHLFTINDAPQGRTVQVEGVVVHTEVLLKPRRQLVCRVEDNSGVLTMRLLNFYGSQVKAYAVGKRLRLFGEIRHGFFGAEMVHPKCRIVTRQEPLADAMTPVYPVTAGLTQQTLTKLIQQALKHPHDPALLHETVPPGIIRQNRLPGFRESILALHHPPPDACVALLQDRTHPAWQRIKFDELLAQQLSMRLHYRQRRSHQAPRLSRTPAGGSSCNSQLYDTFLAQLPFQLTAAQLRAASEISCDLDSDHPMQRLLQGDVGSGKTIVAAIAALQAIDNGFQAAIMAPTEILAEQHFQKLSTWFAPLGIQVGWLSGSQKKKERQKVLAAIESGEVMLAVGTHALFQEHVNFHQLGLAIIDEQHRFGVHQRLALRMKGMHTAQATVPHQLMMSATPIPRTLSMSYFADLDVSVIDELPPGRSPVVTKLLGRPPRPHRTGDGRNSLPARPARSQGPGLHRLCGRRVQPQDR